ncbi:uncharacterized protein [Antedon mediterranea]|uniref:uncharacterized protein n=1 Tax=Antedon mediterranea TaxID=105859 RepID=UPI003AF4552D
MADQRSKFDDLKFELGQKYDGKEYKKLKFCLFDYLPLGTLTNKHSNGNTLFNALDVIRGKGVISPNDVSLLLEITMLTGPVDAQALVEEYIKANRNYIHNAKENKLSPYRRHLFKAVEIAKPTALTNVVDNYGLRQYEYKNLWDAIFELESDTVLADEPDKIKKFAKYLGKKSQDELQKIQSMGEVPELYEDSRSTEKSKRKLKQRKHEKKDEQKVDDKSEDAKLQQAQENKGISRTAAIILVAVIAASISYLALQGILLWSVIISVIIVALIAVFIVWKFDYIKGAITSNHEIAFFISGLIVALVPLFIGWIFFPSKHSFEILAGVFSTLIFYDFFVWWLCLGFVLPIPKVLQIIAIAVVIITVLVAVVLFGKDVFDLLSFRSMLSGIL